MAAWRGGTPAHTDFSLVCPPTGRDAVRQMQLIRARVEQHGFDYAGGFTLNPRHAIALALVSFDRDDEAQAAEVVALFPALIADAAAAGYAPYRSHLAFMDLIAEQYDANDSALRRLTETIKDAVDPQGILSPGKQGIWPGRSVERQRVR
jgi:4-cresol dehydrogenase (hydroxylating) flavoprotein subunit